MESIRARVGSDWWAARGRMPLFYAVAIAFLAFLVFAFLEPMQFVVRAWLPGYGAPTHRVHHVMIGGLLALLVLSVGVQLYRPAARVGAFLLGGTIIASLAVVTVVAEGLAGLGEIAIFVVPMIVLAALHPAVGAFRPRWTDLDRRLVVLAVVAAIPLLVYAALQLNLHLTLADEHVAFDHYVLMAAGAITIGVSALIASAKPAGWRALAYGAVGLLGIVAIASIAFPDPAQGVNFGLIGGLVAVIWALAYLLVAEDRIQHRRVFQRSDESTVR